MADEAAAAPVKGSASEGKAVRLALRTGLYLSVVFVAGGLAWSLALGDFKSAPVRLGSFFSDGSLAHRVMAVGLITLALTPVARVFTLIFNWWKEHDRRFVAVGLAVLVVLGLAILLGHG